MSTPPDEPRTTTDRSVAGEARRERAGRYAHRTRLYLWTVILVTALVLFIILIAENTRSVKVGWVFGYSNISLVFLVLFSAILGWLLGIATSVLLRRRTRRPRR